MGACLFLSVADNFNVDEKLFVSDTGEPVSSVDWMAVLSEEGSSYRGT